MPNRYNIAYLFLNMYNYIQEKHDEFEDLKLECKEMIESIRGDVEYKVEEKENAAQKQKVPCFEVLQKELDKRDEYSYTYLTLSYIEEQIYNEVLTPMNKLLKKTHGLMVKSYTYSINPKNPNDRHQVYRKTIENTFGDNYQPVGIVGYDVTSGAVCFKELTLTNMSSRGGTLNFQLYDLERVAESGHLNSLNKMWDRLPYINITVHILWIIKHNENDFWTYMLNDISRSVALNGPKELQNYIIN